MSEGSKPALVLSRPPQLTAWQTNLVNRAITSLSKNRGTRTFADLLRIGDRQIKCSAQFGWSSRSRLAEAEFPLDDSYELGDMRMRGADAVHTATGNFRRIVENRTYQESERAFVLRNANGKQGLIVCRSKSFADSPIGSVTETQVNQQTKIGSANPRGWGVSYEFPLVSKMPPVRQSGISCFVNIGVCDVTEIARLEGLQLGPEVGYGAPTLIYSEHWDFEHPVCDAEKDETDAVITAEAKARSRANHPVRAEAGPGGIVLQLFPGGVGA